MNAPVISVVLPVYNAGKFLAEAIESVLCQSFSSWELIIVNDHSTDNSASIATEYCRQLPEKISLYLNEGKGACAARNLGIEKSKGRYLKFLDADDALFNQEVLLTQMEFLEAGSFDLVFGNEWFYKDRFQESNITKKRGGAVSSDAPGSFYKNFPITSNFLIRKEGLRNLQWHPAIRMGDEYFLLFQLFNRGAIFGYQEKEIVKVRLHDSVHRISNDNKKEKAAQTAELANQMARDVGLLKISDRHYLSEFYKHLLFLSFGAMRAGNFKAATKIQAILPKKTGIRQSTRELRALFLVNAFSSRLAYLMYRGLTFRGRGTN